MTYTGHCDLYVAVQDAGINRLLHHVMVQRPSLFNYGSMLPATDPHPVCRDIPAVLSVLQADNPLITELAPLPVVQTSLLLDYIVQVTTGAIDFYPGNMFTLPPELHPPLDDQQFAVRFQVCAGLLCQPRTRVWPPMKLKKKRKNRENDPDCFCLDLFATGECAITGHHGNQLITMNVSGIEIPQLKPDGLVDAMECYALLALNKGILPKISQAVSAIAFHSINLPDSMGSLTLSASTSVPHNPAVEENQFKTFVNIDDILITLNSEDLGDSGGGGSSGTVTRTVRPRLRTGTPDLTAAMSAAAFEKIFRAVVNGFRFSKTGDGSYGIFSAHYEVEAHLEGGSFEMRDDGTIVVKELDVKWDKLKLTIGIDIPEFCVGGGEACAFPPYPSCDLPLGDCLSCVTLPSFCFFSESPDISIPIDLSGLITSEVSFGARLRSYYGVGTGVPNRWQIVVVPTLPFDLDIIDIADTVADLFRVFVQGAIDDLLYSLGAPDWAIDLIDAILGGIENILRNILDIPDDIGEWFIDFVSSIGIFSSLLDDLYEYIGTMIPPVLEIQDPCPVLPQQGILIPVKIPIEYIGIDVNSHEMVIKGDVGN